MKEKAFYDWMVSAGIQSSTAASRLNNCLRVSQFEGDLDEHYEKDKCQGLLSRLQYTSRDGQRNASPRHNVPIYGNIYNGTATLKAAVKKYVAFRNSQQDANPVTDIKTEATQSSVVCQNTNISDSISVHNRSFAIAAAKILSQFPDAFSADTIQKLTDPNFCRTSFNCNFPILMELRSSSFMFGKFTNNSDEKRFYSDIFVANSGRRFMISNDWYVNSYTSNRYLFIEWILSKIGSILS